MIAEKGFKGAGGDREGFEGKKGARGMMSGRECG